MYTKKEIAFWDTIQARVPAYLAAHPITAACSLAQRWEALKRKTREHAKSRSFEHRAQQRQAICDLAADRRAALLYRQQPQQTLPLPPGRTHLLQLNQVAQWAVLRPGLIWAQDG